MRKVVNLEDLSAELGEFAKMSLAKKRAAVARGVAKSIPDLVAASPVDTGLYAQSWNFTVLEKSVILGNSAPYAGIIEYGARPFTPPIGPLLAWAKRVLTGQKTAAGTTIQTGQPAQRTGTGTTNLNGEGYSPEVWALAKRTQFKISKVGMAPRHIMENAIPGIIENIRQEMMHA